MRTSIHRHFGNKTSFAAKNLTIHKKPSLKPDFTNVSLEFGHIQTDHMVEIKYSNKHGWSAPAIIPFQHLQIHPFNSTLHYSLSAFEGMKAYRTGNELRLFRPMLNMERFLNSAKRLAFPTFDPNELLKIIEEFVKVEQHWIPPISGCSLYLRPLQISLTNLIGVHAAHETAIYIMASPVGAYFSKNIQLKVYEEYWRGSPKSCAGYKLGCNYGPTVLIGEELAKQGYSQAIWAYDECFLESGASNLFFVLSKPSGGYELVTHPLDNSILPGITRQTILDISKDVVPDMKVSERPYKFDEFIRDYKSGVLKEVFTAGTAAVIGEVHRINLRDVDYTFHCDEKLISLKLRKHILDIQEGRMVHEFSHIIKP